MPDPHISVVRVIEGTDHRAPSPETMGELQHPSAAGVDPLLEIDPQYHERRVEVIAALRASYPSGCAAGILALVEQIYRLEKCPIEIDGKTLGCAARWD